MHLQSHHACMHVKLIAATCSLVPGPIFQTFQCYVEKIGERGDEAKLHD